MLSEAEARYHDEVLTGIPRLDNIPYKKPGATTGHSAKKPAVAKTFDGPVKPERRGESLLAKEVNEYR